MGSTDYLACDLGAESGRLMLGTVGSDRLQLEELHRFPNRAIAHGDSWVWGIPDLWEAVRAGLKIAGARGAPITGISADSWGLDYVLLDAAGGIVPPTFHYRDQRTAAGVAAVRARVDGNTVFAETGIQFLPMNTVYQLAAETPDRLDRASRLLLIGDAFNYFLSGVGRTEVSLASTTQLYNPLARAWSGTLLDALGLPRRLFTPIVASGTTLGPLRRELARDAGLSGVDVIASCSHDTGAAVAAVPAVDGGHWAYISSGTWSLLGVETREPVLGEACRSRNFTNEIGFGNTVRLLKNIVGLWLVQECRRHWAAAGRDFDYAALTGMAEAAAPFRSLINPSDPRFIAPGDMPGRIAAFCRETGQPAPDSEGAFVRCALESLALLYRRTVEEVASVTGRCVERMHVVGGGSRSRLLNQFTADALRIPVHAGPIEATAIGNVLVQAIARGQVSSLEAGRELVRRSFAMDVVSPREPTAWDAAYQRFKGLLKAGT